MSESHPAISGCRVRPVLAPLAIPHKTASGTLEAAPLVLIDITADDGVTGSAYIFDLSTCLTCTGDLDGTGTVDVEDLQTVLGAWGDCPDCDADLDNDGIVGVLDLLTLLGAWGPCE